MKELVLVDSSVWIQATRKGGDPVIAAELGELLVSGMAAMTEPVWLEMYQGIRGKKEEERLEESRRSCTWLAFDDACWTETARTARTCQRAGVNVPFGDIMIFACAVRYGVELREQDRHFAMIRRAMKR
jgi:predicted nucleic acid-binding protein